MGDPEGNAGGRDEVDEHARGTTPETAATPVTQQVGRIALVVVAALFVVFALANAQHVDFSWLVGETRVVQRGGERVSGGVPLIVLLVAAFAAGAVVGSLLAWQRARARRHR